VWNSEPIGRPSTDGLYAACSFEPDDFFHSLEVQVKPDSLAVYIGTRECARARRRVWTGERGIEAAVIGRLLCQGLVSPHEFAAWTLTNPSDPPGGRDTEFDVAHWFRLVPDARRVRDSFTRDIPPAVRDTGVRL
jgi:hypothetical protein